MSKGFKLRTLQTFKCFENNHEYLQILTDSVAAVYFIHSFRIVNNVRQNNHVMRHHIRLWLLNAVQSFRYIYIII